MRLSGSYGRSSTLSGAAWGTTEAQLIIFQSGSRRNKFGTTARGPRDVVEGALDYAGTVTTCVCIYTPAITGVSQCPFPVNRQAHSFLRHCQVRQAAPRVWHRQPRSFQMMLRLVRRLPRAVRACRASHACRASYAPNDWRRCCSLRLSAGAHRPSRTRNQLVLAWAPTVAQFVLCRSVRARARRPSLARCRPRAATATTTTRTTLAPLPPVLPPRVWASSQA